MRNLENKNINEICKSLTASLNEISSASNAVALSVSRFVSGEPISEVRERNDKAIEDLKSALDYLRSSRVRLKREAARELRKARITAANGD